MERGVLFSFLILLFFNLILIPEISGDTATSLSPSDASVIIDTKSPNITIISPLNLTYNNATPILINYTILDPTLDSTWYSLNSQPNISVTGPFSLELAGGSYHLVIYANDSFNRINSSEVHFSMNVSAPPFCGDTTCNAGEDCSVCSTDCGTCPPIPSSSGGGGGSYKSIPTQPGDFTINKDIIKTTLKKGEVKTESFTITNTGKNILTVNIDTTPSLENLVRIREVSFSLEPKKEKTITLDIIATNATTPDLYAGGIIVNGNGLEKEIFTALEINSLEALFDVSVTIPDQFLIASPDEEVLAEVEITDVSISGIVDVNILTAIKNSKGEIIEKKIETKAVKKQLEFIEKIKIPSDIKPGKYIFYAQVNYNGQIAMGSDAFTIKEKISKIPYLIIMILLLIFFIIYIKYGKKIKIKK